MNADHGPEHNGREHHSSEPEKRPEASVSISKEHLNLNISLSFKTLEILGVILVICVATIVYYNKGYIEPTEQMEWGNGWLKHFNSPQLNEPCTTGPHKIPQIELTRHVTSWRFPLINQGSERTSNTLRQLHMNLALQALVKTVACGHFTDWKHPWGQTPNGKIFSGHMSIHSHVLNYLDNVVFNQGNDLMNQVAWDKIFE